MNLDKLIAEGEEVRKECSQDGMIGKFVTGEKYELWIAKAILYLDGKDGINFTLLERFNNAAKEAVGNSDSHLNTMMGVLKALKEFDWE